MTQARPLRVLFDATRLQARAGRSTPTGIDRIDLAYLRALHGMADVELYPVCIDAFGLHRLGDAEQAALLAPAPCTRDDGDDDALWHWLHAPPGTPRPRQRARPEAAQTTPAAWLRAPLRRRAAGQHLRTLLAPTAGRGCLYLNTSHGQSYRPALARWLRAEQLASVFFVHDLLPIVYPQFNRRREPARHSARLRTISAHARHVIVNSEYTQRSLRAYLEIAGLRVPPITVLQPGIDDAFRRDSATAQATTALPYFVMLGTIEPRKNHALLLRLWPRLCETGIAPRLVIVGRRGWHNREVFDLLDHAPWLREHVIEWSGLGDDAVRALLRGARALLAPSHAEGFHLPVAEALALGTPVLASDIPAHREIAAPHAELLGPADADAWRMAIRDYAADVSPRRHRARERLHHHLAPRWPAHLQQMRSLLADAHSNIDAF